MENIGIPSVGKVLHTFEPSDAEMYLHRCANVQGNIVIALRSTSLLTLTGVNAKRLADDGRKSIEEYAGCGIEGLSAAFPINAETGELVTTAVDGQVYERHFRITPSMSGI